MQQELVKNNNILAYSPRHTSYQFPVDHKDTCLLLKAWISDKNTNEPPLLIVHDLGENVEDYNNLAREFSHSGVNTYFYSLRGHDSAQQTTSTVRVKTHVRDLLQICAWTRHKENRRPPMIMGIGVGAIIATDFCQRYSDMVSKLILCAPPLELKVKRNRVKQFCLDLLAEMNPGQIVPQAFCPVLAAAQNPDNTLPGQANKLPFRMNAGFAMELLHLIPRTVSRLTQHTTPTLVLCPEHDEVSNYEQVLRLAKGINYPHLTAYHLAGCPHQIFQSQAGEDLAKQLILCWLKSLHSDENSLNVSSQTRIMDSQQKPA